MEPVRLAIDLARQAGQYQRQHVDEVHQVTMKGAVDPVTEVDTACEAMIIAGIRQHFPQHQILAEEGGGTSRSGEWLWIIDPLDGTVNYAHGYPLYCVCIALVHHGVPALGVVYEPNRDELFVAVRGEGATCNDRPIQVSRRAPLIDCVVATGFAYGRERGELAVNIPIFNEMLWRTRAVRRDGVAGVDLAYVACGRYDGFWEYYLRSWDITAGALLVQEAGGRVTAGTGGPLDLFGNEILATNGLIHDEMAVVIRDRQPTGPV